MAKILILIAVFFSTISSVYAQTAKEYYNRGLAHDKQGNLTQAIADYTKAIETNPSVMSYYSWRGTAYEKQGNFTQAISDYTKAIELDIKSKDNNWYYFTRQLFYTRRGDIYYEAGNLPQAISDYTKAIELAPGDFLYLKRAKFYYEAKEYDKAWADVHQVESSALAVKAKVDPKFLNDLKKASGRNQWFIVKPLFLGCL